MVVGRTGVFKRVQLVRLHQMRHKLGEIVAAEVAVVPFALERRNPHGGTFLMRIHLHGVGTGSLVARVPVEIVLVGVDEMAVQIVGRVRVVAAVAPVTLEDFGGRKVGLGDTQGRAEG